MCSIGDRSCWDEVVLVYLYLFFFPFLLLSLIKPECSKLLKEVVSPQFRITLQTLSVGNLNLWVDVRYVRDIYAVVLPSTVSLPGVVA